MSAKNVDKHNRFRNITVGFNVSPEENELLNKAVAVSGLPKREYCYRKCMNQDVTIIGSSRVYQALKIEFDSLLSELKRIDAGHKIDDDLMDVIKLITNTMCGLGSEKSAK